MLIIYFILYFITFPETSAILLRERKNKLFHTFKSETETEYNFFFIR